MTAATTGRRESVTRLVLYLTYRCPYRCAFCETYALREHLTRSDPGFRELDTTELKRILRGARAYGAPHVIFTGGEPFARSDIYDLIDCCTDERLPLTVQTRHTFIADEVPRLRAARTLGDLSFSIDSHDASVADELAGRTEWFDRYISGIRLLIAAGLPVSCICVINKRNVHQLDDLFSFLHDLGMPSVWLHAVTLPTACAATYPRYDFPRGLALTLSDDERTIAREAEHRWASRLNFGSSLGAEGSSPVHDRLSQAARSAENGARPALRPEDLPRICSVLNGQISVRPDGKVIYCGLAHDIVLGDLRTTTLPDVVDGSRLRDLCDPHRELFDTTDCFACSAFDLCTRVGRCYKRTIALHGTCFAPDPKLCNRFRGAGWDTEKIADGMLADAPS